MTELTETLGKAFTSTLATAVFTQPAADVPVTVYAVVAAGLTELLAVVTPLLQAKLEAPDAFRLAVLPAQIVAELAVTLGSALTVTVAVLTAAVEQPAKLPDTVYTVVAEGVTLYVAVLGPEVHVYVVTPLAERTTEPPAQTVAELREMEGALPTVIEPMAVLTQPAAEVPVTV